MATPKKSKKQAAAVKTPPTAIHTYDQEKLHHVVGLENIRVVIVPDEGSWFAQGLDIDYAAQGQTVEQAQANFGQGLSATIDQHIQAYGHIRELLKTAPPELVSRVVLDSSAQFNRYSQVSAHEVNEALNGRISYLLAQESECVPSA